MGKEHVYKVLKSEIDKAKSASLKRKAADDEPAADGGEPVEKTPPPKKSRGPKTKKWSNLLVASLGMVAWMVLLLLLCRLHCAHCTFLLWKQRACVVTFWGPWDTGIEGICIHDQIFFSITNPEKWNFHLEILKDKCWNFLTFHLEVLKDKEQMLIICCTFHFEILEDDGLSLCHH